MGTYPLLPDNTCHFLVVDFDGDGWTADSRAFVDAARSLNVTVARGDLWGAFTGRAATSSPRCRIAVRWDSNFRHL